MKFWPSNFMIFWTPSPYEKLNSQVKTIIDHIFIRIQKFNNKTRQQKSLWNSDPLQIPTVNQPPILIKFKKKVNSIQKAKRFSRCKLYEILTSLFYDILTPSLNEKLSSTVKKSLITHSNEFKGFTTKPRNQKKIFKKF